MTTKTIRAGATLALLLCSTSPLAAQSTCAGIGRDGVWIGGAEASSDLSNAGTYQEQMALVLGGGEYTALFTLSSPTDLRIEAAGRGGTDPVMDLFDGAGALVATDDDSGGNGAARIETSLEPGFYCAVVRSYDNAPMTAFVRVGRNEHEPLTEGASGEEISIDDSVRPCDSETYAETLTLGVPGIASSAEVPYWRFDLPEGGALTITAENEVADPLITLFDESGSWVAENDDAIGLNSRIDLADPLSPGSYCIAVQALSDASAPITVQVGDFDATGAIQVQFESGNMAPPLDGSYPVIDAGSLQTRLRQDAMIDGATTWFSFDVPEYGLVVVEAIAASEGGDPHLVLFDDLGRKLTENDDTGEGLDSMVAARLNRGTYLFGVKDIASAAPVPVRLALERFVPAE